MKYTIIFTLFFIILTSCVDTEPNKVKSVMTFGGEPFLYAETLSTIHAAVRDSGIEKRQIITKGFFA